MAANLKLRNGIWQWRKMIDGHTFAQSTGTGDRKLAEEIATQWEADALRRVKLDGNAPANLHKALDAFLKEREGTAGHRSAEIHLRHFYELPNTRTNNITLPQVQSVIAKRREGGAALSTLVVSTNYWNAVCNFCEKQRWVAPPKLPRLKAEKTRLRFLSYEEEAKLFAAIDPNAKYHGKNPRLDKARQDNTDFLTALLDLGCRYSEAGQMSWDSVDLLTRKVLVRRKKGGTDSTLVMSDRLHEVLKRRKAEATDQWVFPTKRRWNNGQWMQHALARAGITQDAGRISLHSARHTYASRMIANKLSLLEVQQLLGHKVLNSTLVYAHCETGVLAERAAEILNRRAGQAA